MDACTNGGDRLEDLIARLWAGGAEVRNRARALLLAIEVVAPSAIDQAHAWRVARQLGQLVKPAA